MDAKKMAKVNKVVSEVTKSLLAIGLIADFSNIRDGKQPSDFSMKLTLRAKPKSDPTSDMFREA
jgi:hypothetical protein